MLKINHESKSNFVQDKKYVLSFLESKGVKDDYYLNLIKSNDFGYLEDNIIYLDSHDMYSGEYRIEGFLACSPNSGLDIKGVYNNLKKAAQEIGEKFGPGLPIAGVAGDDVICLIPKTGEVYLWLVGTGEWEKIHLANSVKEFVEMIKYI